MATNKVTTNVIDMSGNAGGLTWVKGTTAQRTTTTLGDLRENTETNRTEIYTDQTGTSEWRNLKETDVLSPNLTVDYLIVAGGGGGGYDSGGGGGPGGYLTSLPGANVPPPLPVFTLPVVAAVFPLLPPPPFPPIDEPPVLVPLPL